MVRWGSLVYGIVAYAAFLLTFLALIAFMAGWLPWQLERGSPDLGNADLGNADLGNADLGNADPGYAGQVLSAILVDGLLVLLFGVQHAVMARPAFKQHLTRWIPPAAERSTFVLATCLALGLMFWMWRPIPQLVWQVSEPAAQASLWIAYGLGFAIVLVSSFQIDHFELFGLRQTWSGFLGRRHVPPVFVERGLYRWVRHPLMAGFLLATWVVPTMTLDRLVFAGLLTAYVAVGLFLEERDLLRALGEPYRQYQSNVPMLVPRPWRRAG